LGNVGALDLRKRSLLQLVERLYNKGKKSIKGVIKNGKNISTCKQSFVTLNTLQCEKDQDLASYFNLYAYLEYTYLR